MKKRMIAMLMAAALCMSSVPFSVWAETTVDEGESRSIDEDNSIEAANEISYNLSNPRTEVFTNSEGQTDLKTTWDCVYFGNYPQSDSTEVTSEPIKWRVLSVNGADAFLLADQSLEGRGYYRPVESDDEVTWETSTLRTWLNNDFYNSAFTSGEQSAIITTTVLNDDNPYYGTEGGNNTQDKVYLLSIAEVCNENYGFPSDYSVCSATRWAENTANAEAQGTHSYNGGVYSGNGRWWLRSPGAHTYDVACVHGNGCVYQGGDDFEYINAVRPVLHLNLSSDVWTNADTIFSGESTNGGEDIISGNYDGVDWRITSNYQLIIGKEGAEQVFTDNLDRGSTTWPWNNYEENLTSILFEGHVIGNGSLEYMFSGCKNLVKIEIGNLDTEKVKDMKAMFSGCESIESMDLSSFNTAAVEDMQNMFKSCNALRSLDVSNFNTSNVTDMREMFRGCNSLVELDIRNFNTAAAPNVSRMFENCTALEKLNISGFNTANAKNSKGMFRSCKSLSDITLPEEADGDLYYALKGTPWFKKLGDFVILNNELIQYQGADKEVTIPDGIYKIWSNAFYGNDITSVIIPEGVSEIGAEAFGYCHNLSNILLPESIETIQEGAFTGCESLKNVYYSGSQEKWNTITKEGDNDDLTNATIHFGQTAPDSDVNSDPGSSDIKEGTQNSDTGTGRSSNTTIINPVRTSSPSVTAPKSTILSKVKAGKKKATLKWKKISGAAGYEIQYGTKKNFKKARTKTIKKAGTAKTTIKKLKAGKKYYFRIRTYKTVNGKKYYSTWSKAKKVKIK